MKLSILLFLMKRVKLVLEDGTEFLGFSFGAETSVSGEVVFNTGMMGYPESMTDASYNGQILVFTYPLIGNYGVPPDSRDIFNIPNYFESDKIHVRAIVIDDYSKDYSHWNAKKSLSDWMIEHNIPGIYGIDTRALTKKLREKGVMLGKVIVDEDIGIVDPNKTNLVEEVSIKEPVLYKLEDPDYRVIAIDCGMKNNIIRCFLKRNIEVIKVPWDYDIHNSDFDYDGIFVSNGPGDPKMCIQTIENLRKAIEKNIPIFGICLGNQILALAAGADTYKLKYGHRSQNQPCIEVGTKKCYITSQNHGYAVETSTLQEGWEPWFANANDDTNEGIRHKSGRFVSIQFHPEHHNGPTDTEFLFDRFIDVLKTVKRDD